MRRMIILCSISLMAALLAWAARHAGPAASEQRFHASPSWLPRPGQTELRTAGLWRWPAPELFEASWAKREESRRSVRVGIADMKRLPLDLPGAEPEEARRAPLSVPGAALRFEWHGDRLEVDAYGGTSREIASYASWILGATDRWRIERGSLDGNATLVLAGDDRRLELTLHRVTPGPVPNEAAFADWTYADTLLAADGDAFDEAALTDERFQEDGPPAALALATFTARDLDLLRGHLESTTGALWSRAWFRAAEAAIDAGDSELAIGIFRRYRAVGSCSMDRHPAEAARRYAEACYATRRLGCFLQLQVQIMADRFDRVAWSSFGEAASATEAQRLESTGVDVDRFLRGLLFEFGGDEAGHVGIGPQRLGRSIHELSRHDGWAAELARWAGDETLDEHNRTRAAQTLYFLSEHRQQGSGAAALEPLRLTDSAEAWLAAD